MKIEDGRSCFYQWDVGQRILMEECPAGVEVHFAVTPVSAFDTVRCDTALVVESYGENGKIYANIPDRLLQVAGKMAVYVFVEADAEGHSALCGTFTVLPRPRPADYVFTEGEIKRWEALDARIKALEMNNGVISPGTGTGIDIPVTSADNGKFMRVVNGAWAAVTVPDAEGEGF